MVKEKDDQIRSLEGQLVIRRREVGERTEDGGCCLFIYRHMCTE